jgi:uncharacterized membrane protein YoaK (UPF0700 family)
MRDGAAKTLGERPLAGVAIVLSAVAGYVDALGWMLLSNVYVANMSGNTIALGRELARGQLADAAARFWPIVTFMLGLFVSELVYEFARRRGRRSSAGWTLGFEAGAIAFVAILPWPPAATTHGLDYYLPTGLLAFAMGLQNATLIRVGASSVYTTHVTGNLTRLAREAAHALLWLDDRDAGRAAGRAVEERSIRRVAFMTAMWLAYGGAAALGVLAAQHWQRRGGLPAVIVLFVLVAADAFQPIGGHERPPEPHPMF